MYIIVTGIGYEPENSLSLSELDLSRMGNLALTQLAELRHRGAFSTVAQAFAACCSCCVKSGLSSTSILLDKWYKVSVHYRDA